MSATTTDDNIVSLQAAREIRKIEQDDADYRLLIESMEKLELLEEMIRFQEKRSEEGQLTLTMMIRGRILFSALEENAETEELRLLTGSYRRHLEYELGEFVKAGRMGAEA